jgi:hypothetical protein
VTPYEEKFATFIKMVEHFKGKPKGEKPDVLLVAAPWVLGDNYEELTESLDRLAAAGIPLLIAPPGLRTRGGLS